MIRRSSTLYCRSLPTTTMYLTVVFDRQKTLDIWKKHTVICLLSDGRILSLQPGLMGWIESKIRLQVGTERIILVSNPSILNVGLSVLFPP